MKYLTFIFLFYFFTACEQTTSIEELEDIFAIYLLKDSTVTASNAIEQSIEKLELSKEHLISGEDIKSYKWDDHSFELKYQAWADYEKFKLTKGSTSGVPFVVIAEKERIYVGTFWWAYSSSLPPECAIIDAAGPLPHKINLVRGAVDKRSDPRIYNSLKMLNVLSE